MEQNLTDLRQMIYDLITDLGSIFTRADERGDLGSITFFYKRLHPERVRLYAIEKLLPHKEQISKRDLRYFDNNQYIFAGLPPERVNYYREEIVTKNRLSPDDMSTMWSYLDSMIALTENIR